MIEREAFQINEFNEAKCMWLISLDAGALLWHSAVQTIWTHTHTHTRTVCVCEATHTAYIHTHTDTDHLQLLKNTGAHSKKCCTAVGADEIFNKALFPPQH